jgi:DNA-binding transcriptional LysR family regulator
LLQDAVWFQPVMASARVLLETNSTHALLAAAHASLGIAALPRFVGRTDETLVAVSAPVAEQDVWLVTHPSSGAIHACASPRTSSSVSRPARWAWRKSQIPNPKERIFL